MTNLIEILERFERDPSKINHFVWIDLKIYDGNLCYSCRISDGDRINLLITNRERLNQ